MRHQKITYNQLVRKYCKAIRRRSNLEARGENVRRQEILKKQIERLYNRITQLLFYINKGARVATVSGSLIAMPIVGFSQSFDVSQTNPYSLTDIGSYSKPVWVDIDGDGDADMITGDMNGDFHYHENSGTPTSPTYAAPSLNPFGLSDIGDRSAPGLVDIDNDGDFDLFSGDMNGDFQYFENTGSPGAPSFGAPTTNPFSLVNVGGLGQSTPSFIDLDNDGDFDLMSGEAYGKFIYYENTGTAGSPTFAAPVTNPFSLTDIGDYSTIAFTDLDNDGDFDLMSGEISGRFYYFRNDGTAGSPSFASVQQDPFSLADVGNSSSTAFFDIDGDGDVELVSGEFGGNHHIFDNLTCPDDFSVLASPSSSVCEANVTVSVSSSEAGTKYTLRDDADDSTIDGPIVGDGNSIDFASDLITATKTYNVLAERDEHSIYVNGSQAGMTIPEDNALDLTNNFTIEGWIKPDGTSGYSRMFNKDNAYALGLSGGQNNICFTRHSSGDWTQAYSFTTGVWYHIACTYSGGTVEFFVDGSSIGSVGGVPTPSTQNNNARIGAGAGGSFNQFKGNIDNVRIWNDVRTPGEISSNMNAFIPPGEPNLVANWYLIEGSGTANDYSGNGLDASAFAGAWQTDSPNPACGREMTMTPTVNITPFSTNVTIDNHVYCNGEANGMATVNDNASGAASDYSYNWSNGSTVVSPSNFSAGAYSVTTTYLSCQHVTTTNINEPSPLDVDPVTITDPLCNGGADGSIEFNTTGGTPGYVFTWAHGPGSEDIFGLTTGNYFVTVTDANACELTDNWFVNQPSAVGVSAWVNAHVLCNGGTDGDAGSSGFGGVGGYSYLWNDPLFQSTPGATGLPAGTWDITVTDGNGCYASNNVVINEPPVLAITTTGADETCAGACDGFASTTVTGGVTPYSYSWSPSGQSIANPSGLCAGTHFVTATDNNGCTITDSWGVSSPPPMSGTYTIGGAGPDYATIGDAMNDLYCFGVSAAVTFNIRDGVYNEQLDFSGPIVGASVPNTITFQSESADPALVTIDHSANVTNNYTIRCNNTGFLTFQNLTIQALDPTYGHAIQIEGGSTDLLFMANDIIGISTTNTGNDLAVVYSPNDQDNYVQFQYNFIVNGSIGIYMSGINGSNLETGFIFTGNTLAEQYERGMALQFMEAPQIDHNAIFSQTTYTNYVAVNMQTVDEALAFFANDILVFPGEGTGINMQQCDGSAGNIGLIANNMILMGNTNATVGIGMNTCSFQDVLHNTVNITSSNVGSFCFQTTGGSGSDITVMNNIFSNPGAGKCIRVDNPSPIITLDYNDYYHAGVNLGQWYGSNYSTLIGWQGASGDDGNSISVDPVFTSWTNLRLNCNSPASVTDGGFDLSGFITDDIDYEVRTNTVSMGADEYEGPGPAMSGIYTIGGFGPDYPDITSAVVDLDCRGISAAVFFDIRDGVYDEQVVIPSITGAAVGNEITFRSESGDSTAVILTAMGNVTDNFTLALDGADYIQFDQITIDAQDATFGRCVELKNNADFNVFTNCEFLAVTTTNPGDQRALVFSGLTQDQGNQFLQNLFYGGSKGVYFRGNIAQEEGSNIFAANHFVDQHEMGAHMYYQDGSLFNHNAVTTSSTYASYKGIYLQDCINAYEAVGNYIHSTTAEGQGIHARDCSSGVTSEGKIYNNFIHLETGASEGIMSESCNDQFVYHNSIDINGDANSKAFFLEGSGGNIDIRNNIFRNAGSGYASFINDPSAISNMDYNDLSSAGTYLGYWQGPGDITGLGNWQGQTGWDGMSIEEDPVFVGTDDLHVDCNSPIGSLQAGANLSAIVIDDFDGESRPGVPTMGADEFVAIAMNGTYTVGGTTPDYATLEGAMIDLMCRGVDAPVIIDIRPGTYNEQISITPVPGASAANNITVKSENGDSSSVVITNASTISDNYTIQFDGSSFFWFDRVTIEATDASYGHVLELTNAASDITITNCVLEGVSTTSISDDMAVIYTSPTSDENYILLSQNTILNGSKGIYSKGTGTKETGVQIIENDIIGFYFRGIEADDQIAIGIGANYLETTSSYGGLSELIYCRYCDTQSMITDNEMFSDQPLAQGIRLYYSSNSATQEAVLANNMIQVENKGIVLENCNDVFVYHNSVDVYGTTARGLDINSGGNNVDIRNNIVVASGGGYAVYIDAPAASAVVTEDYNDIFTVGAMLGHYAGSDEPNLGSWQGTTGYDFNSTSEDPIFAAVDDLHLSPSSPGTLISSIDLSAFAPFDFDGTSRSVTPWMGADERMMYYWVGNAGQWSDFANHWSTTTGGAPDHGTSPSCADYVIFDSNSFSGPGQLLEIDVNGCAKQIDFQDITRTPVIHGSGILVIGL